MHGRCIIILDEQVRTMPRKKDPESHRLKKKRFTDAAAELLLTERYDDITIRRIAEKAGFHNSTIYSYFKDAEWLLALASVRYFNEYNRELAGLDLKDLSSYERFFAIWKIFCDSAFSKPVLYYNYFFGKYKDALTELLEDYYDLYPDEAKDFSPLIREMFFGQKLSVRNYTILKPLIEDPRTRVSEDNISVINFVIFETFSGLMEDCIEGNVSVPGEEDPISLFLKTLHILIDTDM